MVATFSLNAGEFARVAAGRVASGSPSRPCGRISIDTRTIEPGQAFLAIRGPRFDGHDFLGQAVTRGAGALVVSDEGAWRALPPSDLPVVVVPDTVEALQAAARHVRRESRATVIAITGSAGKTTTKEATATLLSPRFSTLRNRGNLNNHIGLPLSLLDLQDGAEAAVVELGMNHAGEIRRLVGIAEPDVRVWTNVGTAHIEYFGSQEAIAAAKAEVLEGADRTTICVANGDDPLVMAHARSFAGALITFGTGDAADVRAVEVEDHGLTGQRARVLTPAGSVTLDLMLPGRANLENVLAAVAVASRLGVPLDVVAAQAATLRPAPHRGELHRLRRDVWVYDDCYNASPTALERTLQLLASDPSGRRRVAFLGEMLELGAASGELHRRCGAAAARAGVERLVTVGDAPAAAFGAGAIAAGLPASSVTHVATSDLAADLVPAIVRPGDVVLVKGSRGTRMERVVDRLQVECA
jgi:UDP-N-acetylmuramoyl-tripeptide--D-alanyl-D-alanine ligase